MEYYLSEGLEYAWHLIRETPHSQKFMVKVNTFQGLKAMFDIHYTRPKIVNVSISFIGDRLGFTDGLTHQLFFDLEKIVKRHGDYKVIDYSLVFGDSLTEGNFGMSDDWML